MKGSKIKGRFITFFIIVALFFSTGWSKSGAFLAGCLTAAFLSHAIHHNTHHTVVYETHTTYERFRCHNCGHRYRIVSGTHRHTCPHCDTVYRWRD